MRNSRDEDQALPGQDLELANGEGNVEADKADSALDLLDGTAESSPEASDNGVGSGNDESLLSPQEVTKYRAKWDVIQADFIDDPARAVEHADNMVDLVIKRLTDSFSYERDQLARRWDQGGDPVSTEEMRLALRGYRALLDRLMLL